MVLNQLTIIGFYNCRHFLAVLFVCIVNLTSFSQIDNVKWLYNIDGYNDTDISDLVVDKEGNTYAAINFAGPIEIKELSVELKKHPHMHGLILKLNKRGQPVWARILKSDWDNRIRDIALAPNGDILFTGFGDGVMHFPGKKDTLKHGREKMKNEYHRPQMLYAARYNKDGEPVWVKTFETPWAEGLCIGANSKDEVFWSFYFNGFIKSEGKQLDTLPKNREVKSVGLLVQLSDREGFEKVLYRDELKRDASTPRHKFKIDKEDNLYTYGLFTHKIKFTASDSLTNDRVNEGHDSYLSKFNSNGEFEWARKIGGQNSQHIHDIDFDDKGAIYAAGQYSYECIIGDGIKTNQKSLFKYKSGESFFYFKMFPDGELAFARYEEQGKYTTTLLAQSIDVDLNNETHILGYYNDTINIDGFALNTRRGSIGTFYADFTQNKLNSLDPLGFHGRAAWIYPKTIESNGVFFSSGAFYYGDSCGIFVNKEPQMLSNYKYGRASFVYGGTLEDEKETIVVASSEDTKIEALGRLKPLLACTNPKELELPNVWFPAEDVRQTPEKQNERMPCGIRIEELELRLFPNPSRGQTNLKFMGMVGGTTQIDVYTEQGKLVYSQQINIQYETYELGLDLSNSSSGIYFIRVSHGGYQKALRFVKLE